jgi:hypothetical protein
MVRRPLLGHAGPKVRFSAPVAQSGLSPFGQTRPVTPPHLRSAYGSRPLRPRGNMLRQTHRVLFHPEMADTDMLHHADGHDTVEPTLQRAVV